MDCNQVLEAGDVDKGIINVVVEVPMGSNNKIEWRRDLKVFAVDRIEPKIFAKPTNYGFIPQTLDEDGDELDVLIINNDPLPTGVYLEARVIGVMKFVDDGEVDDKVLVVPADDRDQGGWMNSIDDDPVLKAKLEHHFTHYKDLKKPGSTVVKGWGDAEEAKAIIRESQARWTKK